MVLEHNGERMIPEQDESGVLWEHFARYIFACSLIKGRDVLDIASGEGYGSAAMVKAGAKSVTGVDVAADACDHARKKYGIKCVVGSADSIPLAADSVDVVVSFETLEHVKVQDQFVSEIHRVLRPGGSLIISTPNREIYHKGVEPNPFHVRELNLEEFQSLLSSKFDVLKVYGQRPKSAPIFSRAAVVATASSPWASVPVVRSVTWRCRRWLGESLNVDELKKIRENAPSVISDMRRNLRTWFHQSSLFVLPKESLQSSMYLVAVAIKRQ